VTHRLVFIGFLIPFLLLNFVAVAQNGQPASPTTMEFVQDGDLSAKNRERMSKGWGDQVVASVGESKLTAAEWKAAIENHPLFGRAEGDRLAQLAEQLLRSILYNKWLATLPKSELPDPFKAIYEVSLRDARIGHLMSLYRQHSLPEEIKATDDEVMALSRELQSKESVPERVSFSVLFRNGTGPEEKAKIEALLADAQTTSPEGWEALINTQSQSTMKPPARIIGPAARGTMMPQLSEPLFDKLEVGQFTPVIEMPTGFAIARLEFKFPKTEPSLDSVRDTAVGQVTDKKRAAYLNQRIDQALTDGGYKLLIDAPPTDDIASDAPVFELAGETYRLAFVQAHITRHQRLAWDDAKWAAAVKHCAQEEVREQILLQLVDGDAGLDKLESIEQQTWIQLIQVSKGAELTSLNDEQFDSAGKRAKRDLTMQSDRAVRVVFFRPGQVKDESAPKSVPTQVIMTQAKNVRDRLVNNQISPEDAAKQYSTDPESKANGGLVRTGSSTLDPDLLSALIDLPLGEWSEPIRLDDGFVLAMLEKEQPDWAGLDQQLRWHGRLNAYTNYRNVLVDALREKVLTEDLTRDDTAIKALMATLTSGMGGEVSAPDPIAK